MGLFFHNCQSRSHRNVKTENIYLREQGWRIDLGIQNSKIDISDFQNSKINCFVCDVDTFRKGVSNPILCMVSLRVTTMIAFPLWFRLIR